MRMQVSLDSLFARPSSAPILGGKKGEFRDWTNHKIYHFKTDRQWIFIISSGVKDDG